MWIARFSPQGKDLNVAKSLYNDSLDLIVKLENYITKKKRRWDINFVKIVILISILSNSLFFAFSSSDVNEKMRIANEFYQRGKYKDAISIYEEILDANYTAPELYYNLGNAYYRIGKIGKAILNYERALKLSPGDDDIFYNLRKVNTHTVDKIEELPKLFIVEWWEILVTMFSFYQW